jgi:hypothetical protein
MHVAAALISKYGATSSQCAISEREFRQKAYIQLHDDIPELHAVYYLDSWGINRTDGSPHRGHELGLEDHTHCPPLLQNEMLLGRAKEPHPASP